VPSGFALGLVTTAGWILATRRGPIQAAIEIDGRFGLKERVSSTLAISPEDRRSAAGKALIEDAAGRVQRIDVAGRFPVRPGKPVLLPLLPGVLAVLVACLVPSAAVETPVAPAASVEAQQVQAAAAGLHCRLADGRKQAEQKQLKDTVELLKRLEEGSKDLAADGVDRKQALVKLNDLSRQLETRRKRLGSTDQLKRQLRKLRKVGPGPADELVAGARQADFKKAAEELEKIRQRLAEGDFNQEQLAKLAEQFRQMQQELNPSDQWERRIRQLRNDGRSADAESLQQQLDELLQQNPQMKRLDELGRQLGHCGECLREGRPADAGKTIDRLQNALKRLQRQRDEMELLDEAKRQLVQTRARITCGRCAGAGCEDCQGALGLEAGHGQGLGLGPETPTHPATHNRRVAGEVGPGPLTLIGPAGGSNDKGRVQAEIKRQHDSLPQITPDAMTGRRIPRKHRAHVREYFTRVRGGE